jgi:hypothetical protein
MPTLCRANPTFSQAFQWLRCNQRGEDPSGTRDERGQALEKFQRGHHEMGGAIAIRGFELEDDRAGWGAAQAFVAQGRARDVATEAFKFLPLMGAAAGVGMQAKPLGTDTALGLRCLWVGKTQRRVFPRQHFLAGSISRYWISMIILTRHSRNQTRRKLVRREA